MCGITINHYTTRVLSDAGKAMSGSFFRLLAVLAELNIFFQVGMNVVLYVGVFDFGFVAASCVVSRVASLVWRHEHTDRPMHTHTHAHTHAHVDTHTHT